MNHGSLFSGLGGFDLAAQWIGWENQFHSDIDPFCLTVLKHHFPNATTYTDIRQTDFTCWRGKIDVLSGGFPCQPYSQAGKRKGTADDRHLWPEMLRAIREIRPRWVLGENVLGIVNWDGGVVFEQVCSDLETENYSVQPFILPACGVNAPHQRYRTWFIAHRNDDQLLTGIQFEEWTRQAAAADGGIDVGHADGHGACAERGTAGGQASQSGGICGARGRRTVTHSYINGYEMRAEGSRENNSPENGDDLFFGTEGSGIQWSITDPDGVRPENLPSGSDRENDHPGKRRNFYCRITHDGPEWTSTHTQCGRGGERREDVQPEKSDGERIDRDGGERDVADTDCRGLEGASSLGRNGEYAQRQDRFDGENGQSPDTDGPMSQCRDDEGSERRDFAGFGTESFGGTFSWQEFPTQSPVCRGDDGLSEILHGITFPRWRKESIKAYGNAIVPQLAYRIFRVIEYMSNGK